MLFDHTVNGRRCNVKGSEPTPFCF
jgi:hypothetical protein